MNIERQAARRSKNIPLVSLIDVVFQLLIYFMLTTSFTRSESLELSLPSSAEVAKSAQSTNDAQTIHIYIANTGETYVEQTGMKEEEIIQDLKSKFALNPDRGVLLLSADQVSVKTMVHMMDRIYTAGGKNIAVADWIAAKSTAEAEHG